MSSLTLWVSLTPFSFCPPAPVPSPLSPNFLVLRNTQGTTNLWTVLWSLPFLLQFIRNKLTSCWNKWVLQGLQIAFVVCQWEYECGMKLRRTCFDLGGGCLMLCEEWMWFPRRNSQQSELFKSPEETLWSCVKGLLLLQGMKHGWNRGCRGACRVTVMLRVTLCSTHSSTQRWWIQPTFT